MNNFHSCKTSFRKTLVLSENTYEHAGRCTTFLNSIFNTVDTCV